MLISGTPPGHELSVGMARVQLPSKESCTSEELELGRLESKPLDPNFALASNCTIVRQSIGIEKETKPRLNHNAR